MIRAVICVPLHKGGRLVAAMAIHQKTPRRWTEYDVRLALVVANRCWEALERAKVTRVLQTSEERFRTLADNIAQLAWMADAAGDIFWYNQRGSTIPARISRKCAAGAGRKCITRSTSIAWSRGGAATSRRGSSGRTPFRFVARMVSMAGSSRELSPSAMSTGKCCAGLARIPTSPSNARPPRRSREPRSKAEGREPRQGRLPRRPLTRTPHPAHPGAPHRCGPAGG
jgi:hypothetical protein